MKILHIIQRYHPAIGGSESWCRNISRFSSERGIITEVATINLMDMAEAFDPDFLDAISFRHVLGKYDFDENVYIRRYALWKRWSYRPTAIVINLLLSVLKLSKTPIGDIFVTSAHSFEMYLSLFREIKNVDIVALHTLPYFHNLVGFVIAKLYDKKIIAIPHFHPGHPHYERKIFFKMFNHCDSVIVQSAYEKEHLIKKGVGVRKISITGNVIDLGCEVSQGVLDNFKLRLSKEYGYNDKCESIIFIGRKEPYKGIDILVKACQEIADEQTQNIFLFLVGPETKESLKKYPRFVDRGYLKIINFSETSDAEKDLLLAISQLLVLPSQYEAFGIVFLEAWKHEKPVIGSSVGPIPEIIQGGGLCFEYGNEKDLKSKISLLLKDRSLAYRLGTYGREKLKARYSLEKIGRTFIHICRHIKKQRRILILSHLFPPYYIGGSEIIAYEHAKELQKRGFDVRIFAGRINASARRFSSQREKRDLDIRRINLHQNDFDHLRYANYDKQELQSVFMKELYQYAPDIVHFHNIYALSLKMLDCCLKLHIPTFMTLHDYWGICPNNLLLDVNGAVCIENRKNCTMCYDSLMSENGNYISPDERNRIWAEYYNKIDVLIAPSKYLAERYIESGIARNKFKFVNYGVDAYRFKIKRKIKSKKINFSFIGQVVWHKGVESLLCALTLLREEERKKISFAIIGAGEKNFLKHCEDLARKLDFIEFRGKIPNDRIQKVFQNLDVLIVPSIWPENSPVTIIEALANGTPVIASNIGGIPELIQDGVNGFLFAHDDPLSLAVQMRRFIDDPQLITQMRDACVSKAKEYDSGDNVQKIIEYYKHLVT